MSKRLMGLLIAGTLLSSSALSSTIAIIDSGTDMKHEVIAPKAWINTDEIDGNNRDEDRNGYQDDIYGWNFAESNNQVIDYSYLGTLNDDIRKFFDIQAKMMVASASTDEIKWLREKVQDEEFIKTLSIYGNFMHGTHVAGISAEKSEDAKIMAVKLIPTEVKLPFMLGLENSNLQNDKGWIETLVKKGIDLLANTQMTQLEEISYYVAGHKARVANGSFGTGYPQAKMIVETVYKQVLRKDPDATEVEKYAKYFINALINAGQKIIKAAPETLFVYAAGNDGLNNDEYGTSPANIKGDNVLTVAATMGLSAIAPFSNYGKKLVDVAAPGVSINSAVPGDQYLRVSGTSQAAPFVAGVAGKVLDINPALTPKEVKEIILGTVDKKEFLAETVATSGIVNNDRAARAALLSLSVSVTDAISRSRSEVRDMTKQESVVPFKSQYEKGIVLPLSSGFKL